MIGWRGIVYGLAGYAALIALLMWGSGKLSETKAALRASTVQVQVLEGQLVALQERTARMQTQVQTQRRKAQEFSDAVRQESAGSWGGSPVPPGVARELCKQAKCAAPSGAVPAPAN